VRLLKSKYNNTELAEILRVSKRAIGDYLKKGILVREGKLFSRTEIARILGLKTLLQEFEVLRACEVAEILRISANSVYRFYKQGRLHCIKLMQTSIFFRKDVNNLLRLREEDLKQKGMDNF
jgi:predicted DNA-binding transcriptional regulator AlpA